MKNNKKTKIKEKINDQESGERYKNTNKIEFIKIRQLTHAAGWNTNNSKSSTRLMTQCAAVKMYLLPIIDPKHR